VVQWEDLKYESNRAHTYLGKHEVRYDPFDRDEDHIYPDYVALCASFGVECERVLHKKDLDAAMDRLLASKETYVLDVMTPFTEHVLPMIPGGGTYKDIIVTRAGLEK
ncbi:MAG: acetolactate synthase large subunit, partial [Verrucomicrobiales bacterium]